MKTIFTVALLIFSVKANADLLTAPDGVLVGPDVNGRTPIYDSDSWVENIDVGSLSAGEVHVYELTDVVNVRGADDYICHLTDPNDQYAHPDEMLIMGCWTSGSSNIKVRIKNVGSSTIDFGSRQFQFLHFNTSTP